MQQKEGVKTNSDEEADLLNSISTTQSHIQEYRQALENAQLDEALDSWAEAVQVLQKETLLNLEAKESKNECEGGGNVYVYMICK